MAKIVVVDGDAVVQSTIRQVPERAGPAFVATRDGQRVLSKFRDGLRAMRLILKRHPDAPIVMTSDRRQTPDSIVEPDHFTMTMKLGVVSALQKPFKPAALFAMVADGLASASRAGRSKPGYDALSNA